MVYLLELLLVFMIIAAVVAIWTRDLLSSVIAVGAVGFVLSIAFLLLRAPDVAITQIVVEALTLVMLIRATVGRDVRTVSGSRPLYGAAVSVALVVMLLLFAVTALQGLAPFSDVTSVLLDFRAYDTLGEATVLFAAIVGALTLLRARTRTAAKGGEEGVNA